MASKLPKEGFLETTPEGKSPARVYLQVPADQVSDVELNDQVSVTFKGKIVGLDVHKSGKTTRASIDVEDPTVSVKAGGQIEDFDESLDA